MCIRLFTCLPASATFSLSSVATFLSLSHLGQSSGNERVHAVKTELSRTQRNAVLVGKGRFQIGTGQFAVEVLNLTDQ